MNRAGIDEFEWDIVPLARFHDVRSFDCGEDALNAYLRRFAERHARQGISKTYVAFPLQYPSKVIGYVSISTGAVASEAAVSDQSLPRFPIPVIHTGRLAVSVEYQNMGVFGPQLLAEVYEIALEFSERVGCHAIDVIAKSERVKRFYKRQGFIELKDDALHLWIRLKDIRASNASKSM